MKLHTAVRSLALLLTYSQALASADPASITAKIGNRDLVIPGPHGYFEITANREQVRRLFEAGATPENRQVAVFAPPSEIRSIDTGGPLRQWAVVQAVRSIEYENIDAKQFQSLRSSMRSGWIDAIERVKKRLGRELNEASERIASELDLDVAFAADDVVPIGVFLDRPDAIGVLMRMRSNTRTATQAHQATILGTMIFLHSKNRVISLYVYREQDKSNVLVSIKEVSISWVDAVKAAN